MLVPAVTKILHNFPLSLFGIRETGWYPEVRVWHLGMVLAQTYWTVSETTPELETWCVG